MFEKLTALYRLNKKKFIIFRIFIFLMILTPVFEASAQHTQLSSGGSSPLNFSNTLFGIDEARAFFPIDYGVNVSNEFS